MEIKVKNMVCDRCKKVLKTELERQGFQVSITRLGEVNFQQNISTKLPIIQEVLVKNGFELVKEEDEVLIMEIKNLLIAFFDDDRSNQSISKYLSCVLKKEYSKLSKLFSIKEGITIEKYFIRLKIEKVKEGIQMNNKTFSEIAYELNYTSVSYLARQFKSVMGISMGEYKKTLKME